jgi:hypothetical protein
LKAPPRSHNGIPIMLDELAPFDEIDCIMNLNYNLPVDAIRECSEPIFDLIGADGDAPEKALRNRALLMLAFLLDQHPEAVKAFLDKNAGPYFQAVDQPSHPARHPARLI